MMKTVLIPTDFSKAARIATEYALKLFTGEDVNFILLSTFHPEHSAGILVPVTDHIHKDVLRLLDKEIDYISNDLDRSTDNIEIVAMHGTLINVIEKLVEQHKVHMVVMGTKGDSALKSLLIGSNTWHVINQVDCPVLSVPEGTVIKNPERILFATDGKNMKYMSLLNPLKELANEFGASIKTLHVVSGEPLDQEYYNNLQQKTDEYFAGIEHQLYYELSDDIPDTLEGFVREHKSEMLVMIPSESNLLNKLFHKSITKKMVLHTDIPLLAINGSFN